MPIILSLRAVLTVICAALVGCAQFRTPSAEYVTVRVDKNKDTTKATALNEKASDILARCEVGKPCNTEKAQKLLEKALASDVTYGPAHCNLGKIYFHQANYYLAAWEFEYAIKSMPQRPEPYNNLGQVYEAVDKFEDAVEMYQRAHTMQPENPEYIGNLARVRLRRGDTSADVRQLLESLIFYDTRPDWTGWAREQLATSNTLEKEKTVSTQLEEVPRSNSHDTSPQHQLPPKVESLPPPLRTPPPTVLPADPINKQAAGSGQAEVLDARSLDILPVGKISP